jgi:RTX calcium-binding nonapeptide repeat (4 copies)
MELANGVVYAQDASSKSWYTWNQSTFTASAAPPAGTGTTTGGITTTSSGTIPPVPPSDTPASYSVAAFDTSTDQPLVAVCQDYTGPVLDLDYQYINITSDNLNITAVTPNCFIHSGSGDDAIAVNSGTNVLDGGNGSNFLTGGSGADTFFVDDRAAQADVWSTVNNFQAGDAATIWGVTPQDFGLTWVDGQGAAGFTGLTLHATAPGRPTASLTLAGFSQADLGNGRLSVMFGADPASGSAYMYVHGNS